MTYENTPYFGHVHRVPYFHMGSQGTCTITSGTTSRHVMKWEWIEAWIIVIEVVGCGSTILHKFSAYNMYI